MVKAMEQEQESLRSRLFHFKGMLENTRSHTKSLSIKSAGALDPSPLEEEPVSSRSQGSKALNDLDKVPRPRKSKEEIVAKEAKDKIVQCKHYFNLNETFTFL